MIRGISLCKNHFVLNTYIHAMKIFSKRKKTVPKYCLENFCTIFRKTVFEMLHTAKAPETESGRCHQSQDVS